MQQQFPLPHSSASIATKTSPVNSHLTLRCAESPNVQSCRTFTLVINENIPVTSHPSSAYSTIVRHVEIPALTSTDSKPATLSVQPWIIEPGFTSSELGDYERPKALLTSTSTKLIAHDTQGDPWVEIDWPVRRVLSGICQA